MIRVLVNGARGRMGSQSVEAVAVHPRLDLVGQTDRDDSLEQVIADTRAEVVVDFTVASVGYENCLKILSCGAHPVIGTSGFQDRQVAELQQRAKEAGLGGVIAPNFALGAVLMMKFAAEAARYLPHMEIIELHHDKKEDSPSGTSLRTAEMIRDARTRAPDLPPDRPVVPGARGAALHHIPIHSVRLPGLVAHQQVLCGGEGETLTIRHDSLSRASFMPGVCLACERAPQLDSLVYGLESIL